MLSIVIPTLNEEKYLPFLLEAIKNQDFNDNYEIIVADANSEDRTVEIAKNYGCKIAPGGIPSKGRNQGAEFASGDLFLFLDADNICLSENFLEKLLKEFKERDLGIATFPVCPNGNKFDKLAYRIYNFWARLTQNFLPHATNAVLVKKEIHYKISGFDEKIKIGEDHVYARTAAKIGKFGFAKIEPVLTSTRRFDRDGRLKTYLKYLLAGAYMFFLGPVKSDIFKYRFNHCSKNKKKL